MSRTIYSSLLVLALSSASGQTRVPEPAPRAGLAKAARAHAVYDALPLRFEENHGQTDAQVRFLTRSGRATVFLTGSELVMAVQHAPQSAGRRSVLSMRFVGANGEARAHGLDPLSGGTNYIRGGDPKRSITNVPSYAKVLFRNVYPGIDLLYFGKEGHIEYDFHVAPGADPKRIRMQVSGADGMRLDSNGDFVATSGTYEIRQHKPIVYQEANGRRRYIPASFQLYGNDEAGFTLGDYQSTEPLIIDPVLSFVTLIGGSNNDFAWAVAVDAKGSAYITGQTASTDFPATAGASRSQYGGDEYDAFVTKLSGDGLSAVYSTYIDADGCTDQSNAISIDQNGNAYIAGQSYFHSYGACAVKLGFLAKLDATGSTLLYFNSFGEQDIYGDTSASGVAADARGFAYVTGSTSFGVPTTSGALKTQCDFDAFVLKFDTNAARDNSLVFGTCLGGETVDSANAIAIDADGNSYITGETSSNDFPTTSSAIQPTRGLNSSSAFMTKLDASGGTVLYSTFLGGSGGRGGGDGGTGIAVDTAGKVYVAGYTDSSDFPTTPNAFQPSCGSDGRCNMVCGPISGCRNALDAFVAKIDTTASGPASLLYSTYAGGTAIELAFAIAIDSHGVACVTGTTSSPDFPTANAVQPAIGGSWDAFVLKIDTTRSGADSLLFSTFLGGSGDEDFSSDPTIALNGGGIAMDSHGNAYVAGYTSSSDFKAAPDTITPANHGGIDAFVAKIIF